MFQFPTGWNSTDDFTQIDLDALEFQFPTGWNSTKFDGVRDGIDQFSFNSQRDGILPTAGSDPLPPKARFNSQRDGILLLPMIIGSRF